MLRFSRLYSKSPLKERFAQIIPQKRDEIIQVRKEHGSKSLGTVTVDMVYQFNLFRHTVECAALKA